MELSFWVWLAVLVGMLILEAVTVQLVSIWFVCGAFAAIVASLCHLSVVWQITLFIVFSALALIFIRPLFAKRIQTHKVPTNADMVIGQTAIVTETIDNDRAVGRVRVSGLDWSARAYDNTVIPPETKVGICAIDGVKLIVIPIKEA